MLVPGQPRTRSRLRTAAHTRRQPRPARPFRYRSSPKPQAGGTAVAPLGKPKRTKDVPVPQPVTVPQPEREPEPEREPAKTGA